MPTTKKKKNGTPAWPTFMAGLLRSTHPLLKPSDAGRSRECVRSQNHGRCSGIQKEKTGNTIPYHKGSGTGALNNALREIRQRRKPKGMSMQSKDVRCANELGEYDNIRKQAAWVGRITGAKQDMTVRPPHKTVPPREQNITVPPSHVASSAIDDEYFAGAALHQRLEGRKG